MVKDRAVKEAYLSQPSGRRPVGRRRYRWIDSVKDLLQLKDSTWREVAKDRVRLNFLISETRTHFGSQNLKTQKLLYWNKGEFKLLDVRRLREVTISERRPLLSFFAVT
ncbi:unnamed protein product [Pieris macdunnoughi]|uniref:Uncharacterized protein n=1 Tax=Pieris macdunnoughi TaxID=345717 RepID=A0A821TLM4_9NEOP|nr:unnamed protein product [Pieris macdunnoughi]